MQLNPVDHHPQFTGPTYNHAAEAARHPTYREEPFQMKPGRLPVNLRANMRPRPRARSGSGVATGIKLARVPVLVRDSNNRPIEAGEGLEASRWGVSDPSWHAVERKSAESGALPGMGLLGASSPTSVLVAIGVGMGALAWVLSRR